MERSNGESMTNELSVLLDMDDVLCDLTGPWMDLLNKRHGTTIKKEDLTVWHIGRALPIKFPSLTSSEIYAPLDEPGLFRNLPMMPGAKQTLETMKNRGWKIAIVTSLPVEKHHPGQVVQEKIEWIGEHLSGVVEERDVIITHRKDLVRGDILVDDAPHNLETFPGKTIAFDRPWNRNVVVSGRVSHWNQMIEECKTLCR